MREYPKDLTKLREGVEELQRGLDRDGFLTRGDLDRVLLEDDNPYTYNNYTFWVGDIDKWYEMMQNVQDSTYEIMRDSRNNYQLYDKFRDELINVTAAIDSYLYRKHMDEHPEELVASREIGLTNSGIPG